MSETRLMRLVRGTAERDRLSTVIVSRKLRRLRLGSRARLSGVGSPLRSNLVASGVKQTCTGVPSLPPDRAGTHRGPPPSGAAGFISAVAYLRRKKRFRKLGRRDASHSSLCLLTDRSFVQ
jgi:hypothetical protein